MLSPTFMQEVEATRGNPDAFCALIFGAKLDSKGVPHGLHAGQRRYVENATADVNFLLPGNSFGKTELIVRMMTYCCWFKVNRQSPDVADYFSKYAPEVAGQKWFEDFLLFEYKVLVASYTYPVAKESFYRFINYHKNREELQALVSRVIESDPVYVEFANGSKCDWGSLDGEGKLVEAARRRRIFVEEAGHIPNLSVVMDSIIEPRTLGVAGQVDLIGTPKPHSDPFLLEIYERGKNGLGMPRYYSQDGSCLENEFWPEDERERVLRNDRYVKGWTPCKQDTLVPGDCGFPLCRDGKRPILSPMGRQVIMGEFILAGGFFFSRPDVARMFAGVEPETVTWTSENRFHTGDKWEMSDSGVWVCKEPNPQTRLYLGGFDLGGNKLKGKGKKGSDPTVGFVIDYTEKPWKIVHYEWIEGGSMDWEQKYQTFDEVFRAYPMMYLLIDVTGQVDSVEEALSLRGVVTQGVQFGGNRKMDMLRNLQLCLELVRGDTKGVVRSPLIPGLKHELDTYVLDDDHLEQDRTMALAMVCHELSQWELPAHVAGNVF